ncbi:hypothetical protein ZHAS_00013034 [Anopheles sinensis]|uniref:Uncharacterized protein n=1 Tax=Anopheles sinensis TaxID=74873 RepID=A0A084W4G9_ANOSI|nr:hypothetical protein ZHAS_00013034 [Anopheles sinensis]
MSQQELKQITWSEFKFSNSSCRSSTLAVCAFDPLRELERNPHGTISAGYEIVPAVSATMSVTVVVIVMRGNILRITRRSELPGGPQTALTGHSGQANKPVGLVEGMPAFCP